MSVAQLYQCTVSIIRPVLHVQVGDLGRSSTGQGTRIDVRRGLRFQSPESICSGLTSKVSHVSRGQQLCDY